MAPTGSGAVRGNADEAETSGLAGEMTPPFTDVDAGEKLIGSEGNVGKLEQGNVGQQGQAKNYFSAARGHVQRVIDVSLLISNMSRLAGIIKRKYEYEDYQLYVLSVALVLSLIAQVIAGVVFFAEHQRQLNDNKEEKRSTSYLAYICVGAVVILNIFVASFDISLRPHAQKLPVPPV